MRLTLMLGSLLMAMASCAYGQQTSSWSAADPGFRPVDLTSTQTELWVCGVGEGIASSSDAHSWQLKHHAESGGALLLGIRFTSENFGYAFGTGGTVVTTTDAGKTWSAQKFGTETILQAAFADPTHGLVRTRSGVFSLNGDGTLHPVQPSGDVLQRFPYTASLAALTPERMGILLSQGPSSEAGFLTTVDGGKSWSFQDPPNEGIRNFLTVDGVYWASGHEVVDKDKPGGGHGVPLAMKSVDGRDWQHTGNDLHQCQAQTCGVCTTSGCLASDSLMVNFYGAKTEYLPIPKGALTSIWASVGRHICAIGNGLACATVEAKDVSSIESGGPQPGESMPAPLNAKPSPASVLTCIQCSFDSIFVDEKLQGRVTVPVSFTVSTDGTVEGVEVKEIASEPLKKKLAVEIGQWLFEPPIQNGKPLKVSTNSTLTITVMRPQ